MKYRIIGLWKEISLLIIKKWRKCTRLHSAEVQFSLGFNVITSPWCSVSLVVVILQTASHTLSLFPTAIEEHGSNVHNIIFMILCFQQPRSVGFKQLEKRHMERACKNLNDYLSKYKLRQRFTVEEFEHWFLPRKDIVYSYVVEVKIFNLFNFLPLFMTNAFLVFCWWQTKNPSKPILIVCSLYWVNCLNYLAEKRPV